MEEIERVYKEYSSYNNSWQFDRLDELLEEDFGTRVSTKEENGFIDIEYNNRMGQYKAKLLIEYFSQNKEFYQYFLQKYSKVVISLEDNTNENELYISNSLAPIETAIILRKILNNNRYLTFLTDKIDNKETLLSEEEYVDFLGNILLKQILDNKKIDTFEYLDLVGGRFINLDLYYEKAIIDISFQNNWFGWLDLYMNGEYIEEIKKYIFQDLFNKYGLSLLNKLLSNQVNLLKEYSNEMNDDFLEKNIFNLKDFFRDELPKVFSKYKKIDNKKDKLKLSKQQIIDLVVEFLKSIDNSNGLVEEFLTNVDNGTIILWDNLNTEERKEMTTRCSNFKKANIDDPACLSEYDDNGTLTNVLVNVPLSFTLEDVWTTIHEFFHFHNKLFNPKKPKTELLKETPSIYFEGLAEEFLINKGYSMEDIGVNFRIIDALSNFDIVLPILNFITMYLEKGDITFETLHESVFKIKHDISKECQERGLSQEETIEEFKRSGFYGDDNQIVNNIIFNLNCILLSFKRSIFSLAPYLLGTIITNNAINNNTKIEDMLMLGTELNNISDIASIMSMVGIDINKYGFSSTIRMNK